MRKRGVKQVVRTIDQFWGVYRFLSNFHAAEIQYLGNAYLSVEHAFQAAKAAREVDRKYVAVAQSPGEAKRRGRSILLRPDWEDVKLGIMRELLELKFAIPELRKLLLDTGDALLIEGNTWGDTFWGECPVGRGSNYLGRMLMEIRTEIQAEGKIQVLLVRNGEKKQCETSR